MTKKKTSFKTINNPLRIGKALATFNIDKVGPTLYMNLKAIEEKAARISKVLGKELSPEDVAIFTFMHELAHYKQWKMGKVTTKNLRTPGFRNTDKCKQLELEADQEAVDFIRKSIGFGKKWSRRTLKAMVGAEKTLTLEEARDLGIIS